MHQPKYNVMGLSKIVNAARLLEQTSNTKKYTNVCTTLTMCYARFIIIC